MEIQFIFGLGTGRCGTGTLTEFLDKQNGIWAKHEGQYCPWKKDLVAFYQSVIKLMNEATEAKIATVAFYWRNYLSEIFRDFRNPKLIVLKRQKEKVVESFSSLYRDKNYWSLQGGENWDGRSPQGDAIQYMFPKYNLPKKEAIGQYWEDYYNDGTINYWMAKFPRNIMLMPSEKLWGSEEAQKEILEFLEIPEEDWVLDPSIWSHKRPKKEKVLMVNREPPKKLMQMALNRALYGQAAPYSGLPTGFDFQLTEEEFQQIEDDPELMAKLNAEQ